MSVYWDTATIVTGSRGVPGRDTSSPQLANNVKEYLSSHFKLKDLGEVEHFLGLEVARSVKGFSICQRKYVLDMLDEHGFLGAKPVSTPIDYNHKLEKATDEEQLNNVPVYHQLIGKLLYLTFTRPKISYAIQTLSQFMDKPGHIHLMATYRVLKSITGFCVFIGESLVSWKSKKQSVVAKSFAEAEYHSMAAACCEVMWLKSLLSDFGIEHSTSIKLYTDSQSAKGVDAGEYARQLMANAIIAVYEEHKLKGNVDLGKSLAYSPYQLGNSD
ncbi:PREDICTED: uncharacterized mitochondrial protein AtMg00810 [Theobroma cacao]|uniref:Uncharacterized mitochondrial protein AtMg00810 n=1 Tax=Theobroma cacao TaxID=3641 RepID=A0AB32X3V7_THECC|nr:PREDICTED: uncharacterized mitochondrial protein AtMg00810 [Theobroma cacao]